MFSTLLGRKLRDAGLELSRAQWRVIGHLSRTDGLTQTQLAELLEMERAPLGTLVDKLEAAGLVERRADKNDRRVNRVFVTTAGSEILPMIREQAGQLLPQITAGLNEAEFNILIKALQTIKKNLLASREASKAA